MIRWLLLILIALTLPDGSAVFVREQEITHVSHSIAGDPPHSKSRVYFGQTWVAVQEQAWQVAHEIERAEVK